MTIIALVVSIIALVYSIYVNNRIRKRVHEMMELEEQYGGAHVNPVVWSHDKGWHLEL